MKPLFKAGQTVITSKGNIGVITEDQYCYIKSIFGKLIDETINKETININNQEFLIGKSIPKVKLGNKIFEINEEKLTLVTNERETKLIELVNILLCYISSPPTKNKFEEQLNEILNNNN